MEKYSIEQKRRFCNRLLKIIFLMLINFPLFSKTLTNAEIRNLVIEPDTKEFFTAQENGYTVYFNGIESSKIQTELNNLPPGVQFVSSKRSDFVDNDGHHGTLIQFWFTFKDVGPVKLPPLIVQVNRRTFYLPFGDVSVYENPALVSPLLEVEFDSKYNIATSKNNLKTIKLKSGEKIKFKVNIKYCVQIINYSWKLPKDSIFTEVKRYEIADGQIRSADFSPKSVPLAKFEWQPLVEGTYNLPQIEVKALSYSGAQRTIFLPEYEIIVTGQSASSSQNNFIPVDKIFKEIWQSDGEKSSNALQYKITVDDCKKIAQLRSKEKHSFDYLNARLARQQFEQSVGIPEAENEISNPITFAYFVFAAICIVAMVVTFLLRHYKISLVTCVLATAIILYSLTSLLKLSDEYGIICGGQIWSVPEMHTSNTKTVQPGLRVKITNAVGSWYYIESLNMNGWVLQEEIVFIE